MEGWVGFAVTACGAVAGCAGALSPFISEDVTKMWDSRVVLPRAAWWGACSHQGPKGCYRLLGEHGSTAWGGLCLWKATGPAHPWAWGSAGPIPRVGGGHEYKGYQSTASRPHRVQSRPDSALGPPPRLQGLQQTCAADSCLGQFLCDALKTWDRHQVPPPRGRASGALLALPAGWGLSSQGTYNLWAPHPA